MKVRTTSLILLPLALTLSFSRAAAPVLACDGSETEAVSNNGVVVLEYAKNEGVAIELQQSATADFSEASTRYQGADAASTLTGLAEGSHYFRIRPVFAGEPGEWSNTLQVTVAYMERGQLVTLLVTGALVAGLTAGAILLGHFKARKQKGVPD